MTAAWLRIPLLALAAAAPHHGAERFAMSYFYDKDDSHLALVDFKFPSAKRGVAAGAVIDKGKAPRPVLLSTSDAGKKWEIVPLKEFPQSLFFLNDSLGWMVTQGGIWRTLEGGRDWQKLKSIKDVNRVHFLDDNRGFAIAGMKTVHTTIDGGKTWAKLDAAAKIESTKEFTSFNLIDFVGNFGLIAGVSLRPRPFDDSEFDWMYPERATRRRETPHLSILLETRDGGKTWTNSAASVFGIATGLTLAPWGGLALFEYKDSFQYPSEVLAIDLLTGRSTSVYHDKKVAVTDVIWGGRETAVVAGYEPIGAYVRAPVPGKVHFEISTGLSIWTKIETDYRAIARRVRLARAPDGQVWAATDTGMILKLERTVQTN